MTNSVRSECSWKKRLEQTIYVTNGKKKYQKEGSYNIYSFLYAVIKEEKFQSSGR